MTIKEKKEICKKMLTKSILESTDKEWLLKEVFSNHFDWKEKKGGGIIDITIAKAGHYNTKCFFLKRVDNTKIDISFHTSLKKTINKKQIVNRALRNTIYPQIKKFRIDNNVPLDFEIDHTGSLEFKDIINIFMMFKNYDDVYKTIVPSSDYDDKIGDKKLSQEFYNLHKNNAVLQAISKDEHHSKTFHTK